MDFIVSLAKFCLDLLLIITVCGVTVITVLFITEFFLDRKTKRLKNKQDSSRLQ